MPPLNRIDAVTLHNSQHWPSGRWIPMRFEVNSWVTLNPDPNSPWGRDSSRYAVDSLQYLWKAQILGFEFTGEDGNLVSRVKVRHAYERRQLYLDPAQPRPRIPCNYLFPAYFDDWVHPSSISGLIVCMHGEVGELVCSGRTPRELYDSSIFFYRWVYVPPSGTRLFGELEPIALPEFNSPAWALPDMTTSEAFRAKLRTDFLAALKPTTGSRRSHCQWWMPITVFIDLFASAREVVRSPTLYTLKNIEAHIFSDIMDSGWHTKTTEAGDIIRCTISFDSVVFRYHIARQTLYANFFFTRERFVRERWTEMEQDKTTDLVRLECQVPDAIPPTSLLFNVGTDWPVAHLRNEVQICMGQDSPTEFIFCYSDPSGTIDRKINRRKEKSMMVADILPPRVLKIRTVS